MKNRCTQCDLKFANPADLWHRLVSLNANIACQVLCIQLLTEMTFWYEKAWKKPHNSLVKYVCSQILTPKKWHCTWLKRAIFIRFWCSKCPCLCSWGPRIRIRPQHALTEAGEDTERNEKDAALNFVTFEFKFQLVLVEVACRSIEVCCACLIFPLLIYLRTSFYFASRGSLILFKK